MYEIDHSLLERIDKLDLSERNKIWREEVRKAPWRVYVDRERWTVESWKETEGQDLEIRRAKLLEKVLDNVEIAIHPFDEIVGRPTVSVIGCQTAFDICGDYVKDIWNDSGVIGVTLDASTNMSQEDLEVMREAAALFDPESLPTKTYAAWRELVGTWAEDAEAAKLKDPGLQDGITPQTTSTFNWEKILKIGLRGFINECQEHIDKYIAEQGTDINKIYFWRSAIIVLEATIRHAHRYAALAREMAEKLQAMEICSVAKIYENPQQNNSHWGRPDQYLYEFFKNDLANGVPLEEMASQISDLIGRWGTQTFVSGEVNKETHQINFGINNFMVGGLGHDHTDMSNELSYLMLHLVALLKLSSPTVGLRWNDQTPDWLMNKAIRTNMETKGGIPLFQNDKITIEHYMEDGIDFDEAVDWRGLGCVYPSLPNHAEGYGSDGIAAINLGGLMHLTLHNGVDINGKQTGIATGDPRDFKTFEDFYEAFFKQHKYLCHRVFWLGAVARDMRQDCTRTPLISILSLDACMDLGQDVVHSHPDYYMCGISDRAIIDAADCFTAVNNLIYKTNTLTWDELMKALDSNFEGERGEEIRQLCLREPKYGNDIEEADSMVKRVSEDSAKVIKSYDNSPFHSFIISREGLAWHYFGGLGAGALPDGRKALEPLNDGSLSPMRGMDVNGPTAVLRSACSSCYSDISYSAVLNQKFSSSLLNSPENIDKLIAYTNAFMKNNGTHIQYNILDTDVLKDAKKHPENYQDLIVRIGGFSAYFVQLSEGIQDDVIYRSEFEI